MNDLSSMASTLGALLKERKETIAVAESSAGGLISAALLAVPGASAYFLGRGVIYTQAAPRGLLRVADVSVKGIRASSQPCAPAKAKANPEERRGCPGALRALGGLGRLQARLRAFRGPQSSSRVSRESYRRGAGLVVRDDVHYRRLARRECALERRTDLERLLDELAVR